MNKIAVLIIVSTFFLSCNSKEDSSLTKFDKGDAVAFGALGSIGLTGKTVSDLLSDFYKAAQSLIFQAESSGNALLQTFGNQINVSLQNANIIMRDQQNQLFDNLNKTEQTFFTELNLILNKVNENLDRAISLLEISSLDLIELTNRLPLTTKTYHCIRKITGLCQPFQRTDYKIKILGLGFGQDDDNRKYEITIKIAGKDVPASSINRVPGYETVVTLTKAFLDTLFRDSAMTFVPVSIVSTVKVKENCKLLFKCKNSYTATWDMKLVLMPKYPGVITGFEVLTNTALDGVTQTKSDPVSVPGDVGVVTRTIPLNNDQRVVGVRYSCSGLCGWSYGFRRSGYDPDYDILNGGTSVTYYRLVQAGPTAITHYVDYQTLTTSQTLKPINPIRFQFGEIIALPLSANNTSCSYRLTGRLVTGQEFYIDNSMSESPNKLIIRVGAGTGPSGTTCQPTFIVNIP